MAQTERKTAARTARPAVNRASSANGRHHTSRKPQTKGSKSGYGPLAVFALTILSQSFFIGFDTATQIRLFPGYFTRCYPIAYYLIGALLGRFGQAVVSMPGGCDLGTRPIDLHVKSFEKLGARVDVVSGYVHATAPKTGLHGATIYMDQASVGATMNTMMAAARSTGLTIIENAAKEPHIVDLANFLNSMGADIMGAGTDVIRIRGVGQLHGGAYSIIPDQIEAGTYMAAVTATGGDVLIKNVIPKHLDCISAKLVEMGAKVEEIGDCVRISRSGPLKRVNVKTMPYPGFPTDMQPQISACLTIAEGTSVVTEGIWENRYRYVAEFRRMGAQIQVDGKIAVIEGVSKLSGAPLMACDLRAGAAMVIAGLAAEGTTDIGCIHYIERGYENLVEKLRGVGADIRLVEDEDEEAQRKIEAV